MKTAFGTVGAPPDALAWIAAGVGILGLMVASAREERRRRWGALSERRWALPGAALLAALLSVVYLHTYLRGGPRIVDATSYYLEARSFARGGFTFEPLLPSGSFRGRFLVGPEGSRALGVLFPPGYPALLALGFLLGAPLALGPVLASALVVATHRLAWTLFRSRELALTGAVLSALSATLRYHTADTMSHGWSALLFTVAVTSALRPGWRATTLAGLAAGWLLATRPVTGLVGLAVLVVLLREPRRVLVLGAAALPGVALLVAHQHALTGRWGASSQVAYYALADGPPGCFRYGLGRGIGCVVEHGEYVRKNLSDGYDLLAALKVTGRRLWVHGTDATPALPLTLALLPIAAAAWRWPGARLLVGITLALIVAYLPFYFDASYPGGGARLYVDALPFEQVLLAWGLHRAGLQRFGAPVAALGFAFHASHEHRALADRDGGRPMFEPSVLERADVRRGLLFTDTDHAFNLAYDPAAQDPATGLVVARRRDDAHDHALWRLLGEPPSYALHYPYMATKARATVSRYLPRQTTFFEAEALWPPPRVQAGWVEPINATAPCARGARVLRFHLPRGPGSAVLGLPVIVPAPTPQYIDLHWTQPPIGTLAVTVSVGATQWRLQGSAAPGCRVDRLGPVELSPGEHELRVSFEQRDAAGPASVALDGFDVIPAGLAEAAGHRASGSPLPSAPPPPPR